MDRIEKNSVLRKLRDGAGRGVLLCEDQVLTLPSDRKIARKRIFAAASDRGTARRVSPARIHMRQAVLTTKINSRRDALIGAGVTRKSELKAFARRLRTGAARVKGNRAVLCALASDDSFDKMTRVSRKDDRWRTAVRVWSEPRVTRTDSEAFARRRPRARHYQMLRALMVVLAKRLSLANKRPASLALAVRK